MWQPRRIYAIGDIHGHYKEMMALMDQIKAMAYDPTLDQVVFLGDLVDVGPDTREVIKQCMKWDRQYNTTEQKHFVFLYGNHEDMLLDAASATHPLYPDNPELWLDQGGDATLKSYYPQLDKLSKKSFQKARKYPDKYLDDEHLRWIATLPYFYTNPDYFFVHAGLPNETMETIIEKSAVNDKDLYTTMIWIRNEFIYSSFGWGKRIIFSHTPTLEPIVTPTKIGLNTMPRNEGKLTALEIPSMTFYYQPKL